MIVAGEASGDLHGAELVRQMLNISPELSFYGVGGDSMQEAGVRLIAHSSEMAVMGAVEVLPRLGFILKVRRKLKDLIRKTPPSLVILIDYPGFNLPMARFAHESGVRVFYYISPKVWAWRKKRIYDLEKYVDRMALILPFEESVYEGLKFDARFVGNPLLDTVKRKYTRPEALKRVGLREGVTTVALLPGSRRGEIDRLLPVMLEMAKILKDRIPSIQFVLPLASTIKFDSVNGHIRAHGVEVSITQSDAYDVVGLADIAVVASGTATLETALLEVPMIIVYKVSPITYIVGSAIVHVDHIGLVNLIAGRTVAPELIQSEANAENMANEVFDILDNSSRLDRMKRDLLQVKKLLGEPGAAGRAARLAYDLIGL